MFIQRTEVQKLGEKFVNSVMKEFWITFIEIINKWAFMFTMNFNDEF